MLPKESCSAGFASFWNTMSLRLFKGWTVGGTGNASNKATANLHLFRTSVSSEACRTRLRQTKHGCLAEGTEEELFKRFVKK